MSLGLDDRARRAADNLKAAVDQAPLLLASRTLNGSGRRRVAAVLRPVWIASLLILGSAIGFALVVEPTVVESTTSTTAAIAETTTTATTDLTASTTTATTEIPVVVPGQDLSPPPIVITSPEDGAVFEEKTVEFVGTTEPGAVVLAGPYEAAVDQEGNWRITLVLSAGPNRARFVARDLAGNEAEATITVVYSPPVTTTVPATTTTTKQELAPFDANATFGSCSEEPPFDIYYGVGEPGSIISVQSEFGSGVTTVNGEGHWEIQVFFPEAPPGEGFLVKVIDEFGRKETFEFVFLPGI